jgi:arachidonate 5-lipoxygenase
LTDITVYNVGKETVYHFPIYQWLSKPGALLAEGKSILPQHSSDLVARHRQLLLTNNRSILQWTDDTLLPNHANIWGSDKLPKNLKFSIEKRDSLYSAKKQMLANLGLSEIKNIIMPLNEFEDYKKLFVIPKPPALVKNWDTDEEFGYQALNGTNPLWIRKCTEIPKNFAVTNETVKGLLREGKTLEEEIQAGRVWILDYGILTGIKVAPGRFMAHPFCLMYVGSEGRLLPIAIQLEQEPGPENPVSFNIGASVIVLPITSSMATECHSLLVKGIYTK